MKIFTQMLMISAIVMVAFLPERVSGQDIQSPTPVVEEPVDFNITPPLTEMTPTNTPSRIKSLNKEGGKRDYPYYRYEGEDPVWQKEHGSTQLSDEIGLVFEGTSLLSGLAPSDDNGDIGPNHYVQTVNSKLEIYDREGNNLYGPVNINTLFTGLPGGETNNGDPIVLYDQVADRWLISQFSIGLDTKYILIAVSQTSDPTGSYYTWSYSWGESVPDYPKFGVWRDSYLMGLNCGTDDIVAFNRSQMIAGNATAQVVKFDNPWRPNSGLHCVQPLDNDGTFAPSGTPGHFITINDNAWGGSDQLWIYELNVNWVLPFFSTFTRVQQLNVAGFDSNFGGTWDNIPQPGTAQKLELLPQILMYRAQYRNFGSYESIVCCHDVDVNGSDHAGIRWYELRRYSGNWYIYQQGTYAPDSHHRWMGSIVQNGSGEIALGYTISSSSIYPSIRYTGRKSSDPLGTMGFAEGIIHTGSNSQTDGNRWGDYSCMSVDPVNDKTFWYTSQYTLGGYHWRTKVAAFEFDGYCEASSSSCDEYIARVEIGTIDNASDCDNYRDYSYLSTEMPLNGSETIEVTNGSIQYSSDQCGIWVDWNQDEDFYDSNEQITVSGTPGVGPYTATISPPAGVSTGDYKIRIRIAYTGDLEPCGTASWGEVEDYTITLTNAVANVWTGSINRYWHNSGNWSLGHIPTAADPVEIPDVGWQPVTVDDYPSVANESCKSLLLESDARLRFYNQELVVEEDAIINGDVIMDQEDANFTIVGDIIWNSGSSLEVNNSMTFFNVYGNWEAYDGSDLNPEMGFVDFKGSSNGYIRSYDVNNTFYNLRIYKYNGAELGLSAFSSEPLRVENLIFVTTGALFNCYTSEDVILEGAFNFYGTFDMTANFNTSSFIFDGANPSLNDHKSGSGIFNNVIFSASNQAISYSNFQVLKNLTIEQGVFNASSDTVSVAGNWINSVGPDGFIETDSRVIFNGPGHQYVYGDEHFNVLDVNNGAALRLNNSSYDVSCNSYDWTSGGIDIVAGNFTAYDLEDSGLWGTFWCNPNGTITITQDGSQYVDLNGEIHIFGGTMTVNGGLGSSWWPYQNDAIIQMTGGVLDFPDSPIRISNTSYSLTEDITGGTIKTQWSFWDYRGDFTPEGGTIELYGTSDSQLDLTEGSNLYNLMINKIASEALQPGDKTELFSRDGKSEIVTRANTVTASDTIVILNDFYLNAGTFTAPELIIIGGVDGGDWNNTVGPDAFIEGEGTVQFVGEFMQYISTENFNILEMNKPNGDFTVRYGDNVECQSLKWLSTNNGEIYVIEGTFTAWDLFDSGVYGQYFLINSNSTVNLYQDPGQWTDLNAEIRIDDGTMNVFGGSGASFWPYSADAELTMSNGALNFMDNGIYLNGSSSFDFIVDITGGTIQTNSSFTGEGDDFQPDGGTCELIDESDVFVGIDGGGYFYNLVINKETPAKIIGQYQAVASKGQKSAPQRKDPTVPDTRANTASAWSDFTISNDLIIENGTFDVNGFQVTVNNDVQIYGTLAMSDPLGDLSAGFIEWFAGSEDNVTAGTFHANTWRFNEGTNAMIGTGNTAYLKDLYYSLDDDAEFGNLVAEPFSKLLTNPDSRAYYPTRVSGDFTIQPNAEWFFNQSDAGMIVNGNATIENNAAISFNSNEFVVDGNITIAGTLNVSSEAMALIHGEITWPETGEVNINSNAEVIFDAPNHPDKGWEYINGHLTLTEGLFEITNNSTNFGSTATTNVSGGTIRSGGAFGAINPGVFEPTGGTVELTGNTPDLSIYCYGGNYFYNLLINRESGFYCYLMNSDVLDVKNDLTILSGAFNSGASNIFIGGNWTNNVGPDGFVENTNEVWFYGETFSHIYTDETFYDLYIFDYLTDGRPTSGSKIVDETYIEDGVNVHVLNDCRFLGGSLNMGNNSVLDVDNNFIFNGGQCIVPDGTPAEIYAGGHYENFNPGQAFFPGNSTFTFDGIADQNITTDYITVYFYNLNIDNPGNFVNFYLNTHVYGDVHVVNGTYVNTGIFDHNNTFEGDITVDPNGGFLPKGVINFEGNENTVFNDQSTITSYIWGDLYIDKAADNLEVLLNSDLLILNNYSIDVLTGEVDLNGHTLRCTNNVTIHDGGKLKLDAGANLEVGDAATLAVQNGGTLEVIGVNGNPATVMAWNAVNGHRYYFNVNSGGTISAKYGMFRHMETPNGLNVMDGAIIDPNNNFENCTFRNGETGGGSSYLTINNNQELTISGVSFPDADCDYNVGKDLNQGHILFEDFSGVFAGEDFDYDPNNLIDWYVPTLEANPMIVEIGSDAGSTSFDVISNLDWTATESTGWFSIAPSFGTGNATITVNYSENISVAPRSGEITLSAPEVPDVIVTVNQEGADYIISISPANRNVSAAAGTTTFSVEANPGWTWDVTETVPWLSVSPMNGSGNATLTVTYNENTSTETRVGTINLPGGVSATVTQASANIIFSVTPDEQNVGAPAGSTSFSVTSNTSWTVSESVGWFSVTPGSGSGNGGFIVNYSENTTTNPRSGSITVSATGAPDVVVTVNQDTYMIHEISVPAGWSGLSSYIMPIENSITDVMAPISPNFIILQTLDAMFYPDGAVNTIGTWDAQSAYKIKLSAGSTLDVIGMEETNKTFAMGAGWSLMPVISNIPVDAEGLFTGADVKIVKDVAGVGLYWPEYSINTLGIFVPGRTYVVNMNSGGAITFPPNAKQAGEFEIPAVEIPESPWYFNPNGPGSHAIAVLADGYNGVMPGDVLSVFDQAGNCYGMTEISSIQYNSSVIAFADDPFTLSKDGFEQGDEIALKIYRPQNGEVYEPEATWDLQQPNTGTFLENGISVISGLKVAEVGINQALANAISLYPNPTTGEVKISGIEKFNRVEIFNATGKTEKIFDTGNTADLILDMTAYPSGIYQLKFTGMHATVVKKLIRK